MFTQIPVFTLIFQLTLSGKVLALSTTNGIHLLVLITGMALSLVKHREMSFPLTLVREIGVLLGLYLTLILKPKVFQSSLLLQQKLLNLRNRLMRKSRPCSLFRVSQSINLCQKSQISRPIKNFLNSRQKLNLFPFQIGLRSQ